MCYYLNVQFQGQRVKRHFNSSQSQGIQRKVLPLEADSSLKKVKSFIKKTYKVTMRSQLGERSRILTFTDVTPCVHSNPIKLSPIQFSDTNLPFIKVLPGLYNCAGPVVDYSSPQVLELTQLSSLPCIVQFYHICSPWRIF